MTSTVWIVDDDRSIRWVLEKALERQGLPYRSFANAEAALQALDEAQPTVLVTDLKMPGIDGLTLLKKLRAAHPQLPVILTTAYSDLESAVAAFQGGAFEYLAKPFDLDHLIEQIWRALNQAVATHELAPAQENAPLASPADSPEIWGQAPGMQALFRAIGRLSGSSATVLITGESGSGKELVARALHRHGPRADRAFVAINTAAIPHELLESELFGHERGAFTGAQQQRSGRFEQAQGGTLFLDEIGDMPAELQTRLLRVLSDGHYYRVGGSELLKADVRLIAATHHPLEARIHEGRFREDLFHRLNVIRLRVPPLRERQEDIEALTRHFLLRSALEIGCPPKHLSTAALEVLKRFNFPGNVRQLQNICHGLTVMTASQRIDLADLPIELQSPTAVAATDRPEVNRADKNIASVEPSKLEHPSTEPAWSISLVHDIEARLARDEADLMSAMTAEFESLLITTALRMTRGRKIEAAARLGIGRNTLTRKLHELRIETSRLG